jgi:PAS domain S-box-containing protein
VVTLLDITERKQAEAALRESEWRFRQLADCSPMPIALYDNDEKVTYLNTKFISTFGYTLDDIPTLSSWWPLAYPDPVYRQELVEKWAVYIDKVIRGQKGVAPMEAMVTCRDRSVRCVEFYLSVIGNQKMVILQDITERKQAENDLLNAKAQAELYLDLMSHDITNMNQAMMGYLELMEAAWESGAIDKGLMDSLIVTLNRSSRLISDVKKLTHLQAGKVPLKDVDLCETLAAVKARHSMVPGRIVTISYAPLQDCMVRACDTIGDLFDNLVDNAIRHSRGPVVIDIAVDRVLFEGRRYYRITVADTGPGIPDDLKKKIFLTIQEIEARPERRGFGLYLVRTLIDYHHGKIWVEDRVPGDYTKGANFVVMIPTAEK